MKVLVQKPPAKVNPSITSNHQTTGPDAGGVLTPQPRLLQFTPRIKENAPGTGAGKGDSCRLGGQRVTNKSTSDTLK